MRRGVVAVGVLLVLVGCAPMATAPVGTGGNRVCNWVREAVASGAMPLYQAESWYSHCGPFEVPR